MVPKKPKDFCLCLYKPKSTARRVDGEQRDKEGIPGVNSNSRGASWSSSRRNKSTHYRLNTTRGIGGKVESLSHVVRELREAIDIQNSSKVVQSRKLEEPKAQTTALVESDIGQLLTTGEAYEFLKSKGFDKSIGTFRRALAEALQSGVLSESMTRYGLSANFDTRKSANPKDNSTKWLFFV